LKGVPAGQIIYKNNFMALNIKLDLFYIWRLYRQIWISATNKDMNMNIQVSFNTNAVNNKYNDWLIYDETVEHNMKLITEGEKSLSFYLVPSTFTWWT
jgi:hypothetical protein